MDSNSKRVSPVIDINHSPSTTTFTNFAYYATFLNWLMRLYGVNFDERDSQRPIRFLYYFITFTFLVAQIFNIYFNVTIARGVVRTGEYELLYMLIPAAMAIFRPLITIIGLNLRKPRMARTFGQITQVLSRTYKMSAADIRKRVRHLEVFVVVVIVVIFVSGLISRWILTYVVKPDLMYEKLNNISGQDFPQIYIYVGDSLLAYGSLLEVISAVHFAVFCCLLSSMFDKEHFNVEAILKASAEEARVRVRERLTINCEMMDLVNGQFSTFLLGSFSFQIFTMCFWSRSVTLDYAWIDLKFHLWIVHFIATTSLSFGVQCWAAVSLNEKVYDSIRDVIKQLYFKPEIEGETNDYLILLSLLTSPPQITAWNSFTINKGFVLTVCGTILTYTVALYGMG